MEIIDILYFKPTEDLNMKVAIFEMTVAAGIPNPVEDETKTEVDLNEFLVEHPASTFFAKVSGLNLVNYGIRDGNILIVDSAIKPYDGRLVLVSINNELSVKVFRTINDEVYLESGDAKFLPLNIGELEFNILGTVTRIIHSL